MDMISRVCADLDESELQLVHARLLLRCIRRCITPIRRPVSSAWRKPSTAASHHLLTASAALLPVSFITATRIHHSAPARRLCHSDHERHA